MPASRAGHRRRGVMIVLTIGIGPPIHPFRSIALIHITFLQSSICGVRFEVKVDPSSTCLGYMDAITSNANRHGTRSLEGPNSRCPGPGQQRPIMGVMLGYEHS